MVEYAFLLILVATVVIAVVILAGAQLKGLYQDISDEFNSLTTTVISGTPTCPDGTPAILRGHKYKCNGH
jgi:Flp pilus assembly pilin Flp